jgi:hypothetical protein
VRVAGRDMTLAAGQARDFAAPRQIKGPAGP